MHRSSIFFVTIILGGGVLLTACSPATAQTSSNPQPAEQQTPAGKSSNLNIDQIFPAGPGRNLVLNNCVNCHTITPIVVLQLTKEAWERSGRDHRERVYALNDAEFHTLYDYLIANFNPSKPVPQLPKELLETWTTY